MTKQAHTPGPFRVNIDPEGYAHIRTGDRNEAPDSDLIASVWNDDYVSLIAAAPDLLEVARMVAEASDLAGFSGPLGDAARAAIAKATPEDRS